MAWRLAGEPELQLPSLKPLARQRLVATRCLTASTQFVPAGASWLKGLWRSKYDKCHKRHRKTNGLLGNQFPWSA